MNDAVRKANEAAVYNKEVGQDRRSYKDYFHQQVYASLFEQEYVRDFAGLAEKYLTGKKVLVIGASRKDVDLIWPYTQDVTAVDISALMIEKLVEKYPEVTGMVGDAEKLDFLEGEYDVVFAKSVLHHLHPLDKVLEGVSNRLGEDGVLFVASEPGYWNPFAWLGRKIAPSREHTLGEKAFDFGELERMVKQRFELVEQNYYFLASVMLAVLPVFLPGLSGVCLRLVKPVTKVERRLINMGGWRWAWMIMGVYKKKIWGNKA